jgi:hypothetical protein
MPYHTKKKDKPKMVVVVMKKKDKMKPKKELSKVQKDLMKEIKSKHSKEHMDIMKKAMLAGDCFQNAHAIAMRKVGR